MPENLAHALHQIGLDEREATVYLSVLELGPSPVQQIAQRARIPRATTYLVLSALKAKGLVTTFDKGKKTFFVAESPEQLSALVATHADAVRAQEQLLTRLIPDLKSRGQFAGTHRPTIRFYEGSQAIRRLIREDVQRGRGEILSIFSTDDADTFLAQAGVTARDLAARRKKAGLGRRAIYTWRKTEPEPGRVQKNAVYIPYADLPLTLDVTIVGDRVALLPYDEPVRAIAIEDATVANGLRALFNLLWKRLSPRKPRP